MPNHTKMFYPPENQNPGFLKNYEQAIHTKYITILLHSMCVHKPCSIDVPHTVFRITHQKKAKYAQITCKSDFLSFHVTAQCRIRHITQGAIATNFITSCPMY